jgi:hypothetical protein
VLLWLGSAPGSVFCLVSPVVVVPLLCAMSDLVMMMGVIMEILVRDPPTRSYHEQTSLKFVCLSGYVRFRTCTLISLLMNDRALVVIFKKMCV